MKDYLAKYIESGAQGLGSGEKAILNFFNNLDLADWEQLLRDIVLRDLDAYEVVRPAAPEFLIATARVLFSRTSPAVKVLGARALSRLFKRLALAADGERSAASDLITIAPSLGNCGDLLENIILDDALARDLRLDAARALANLKERPLQFWLNVDYKDFPELIPLMMMATASSAPLKALELMFSLDRAPCQDDALEYPLGKVIIGLATAKGGKLLILDLLRRLPEWLVPVFSRVLAMEEIGNLLESRERESVAQVLARSILMQSNTAPSPDEARGLPYSVDAADLAIGVQALLEQWSPLANTSSVTLGEIVHLFEQYPSRPSFAALLTIAELYISRAKGGEAEKGADAGLAAQILRALIGQSHITSMARESQASDENALGVIYRDLLVHALDLESTARFAFRVLAKDEWSSRLIAECVVRGVSARSLSAEYCYVILSELRGRDFTDTVFQALGEVVRETRNSHLLEVIGVQLYDYSPNLLNKAGMNLSERELFRIQSSSEMATLFFREDPGKLVFMPSVN